jgi:hypothetical protein
VELYITCSRPLQQIYGVKTFMMGRCRIGVNPVSLHENVPHLLMSQFGANEALRHE